MRAVLSALFGLLVAVYQVTAEDSTTSTTAATTASTADITDTATTSYALPDDFLIGASTAAFQIEGAWDEDGKSESVWDHLVHTRPDLVTNGANADVACDSYHKYKEDVQLLKEVGFTHYRFSISWPRILPSGFDDQINEAGVQYYHNLIDELNNNGIIPLVITYHWDLPQRLQKLGGWANPLMVDYYARYVRILFKEYGSKVKYWTTINEPYEIITGYGGMSRAPLVNISGIADYLAAHHLLLAHAKAYHIYDKEFRSTDNGMIGITLSAGFVSGASNSAEDSDAGVRGLQFHTGFFAHPIFSTDGDYPTVVKERVAANSIAEGFSTSRLPTFTKEQIAKLKGSSDYFGLNYYNSTYVTSGVTVGGPSITNDSYAITKKTVSTGLRGILNFIKNEYNNPKVFITENGYKTGTLADELKDTVRIEYIQGRLKEMLKAIYTDGCNVIGYTVWSLMDNFSWLFGYQRRFGVFYVDFDDADRPRTKKESADYFKELISTRKLPTTY